MTESEKRSADRDDSEDRPSKRERGPLIQLRILIPAAAAGPIIGARGENLRRLKAQCKSGAHNIIRVADSPNTPERILMVSCHPDDVEKIILHIGPEICKPLSVSSLGQYKEDELSILLPHDQAGPVIGKSGSNILKLRNDSGAKVRIYKDKLPFSDERILLIQGSQQSIASCVVGLADLLMQFPVLYQYMQYCPQSERPSGELDCGGYAHVGEFSMPMGHSMRHSGGSESGSYYDNSVDLRQQIGRNKAPSSQPWQQPPAQEGTAAQLNQLQQQIMQLQQQIQPTQPFQQQQQYTQSNQPIMDTYTPPQPARRQPSQNLRIKKDPELEIKKTINIPEEFTSSLIGPKGTNITNLRKQAKAKIFIVNDKAEDEPRSIELSGNVRGVQQAEQIIQSAMEDIERSRGIYLLSQRETAETTRTWKICTSVSGAIIGEKGAKIKVIRQHSGAQVHIEKDDDTHSTLTLKGTLQNIKIAEDLITDTLDPTEQFSEAMEYNTRGKQGYDGSEGYNNGNSSFNNFTQNGDISMSSVHSDAQYAEFQTQVNSSYTTPSHNFTTLSSSAGTFGQTVRVIQYDDKHTGAIIGAKGAHIGLLRVQSGCDIQIETKEKPIEGQRICTITGKSDNIQYAESLIDATINKSLSGRG